MPLTPSEIDALAKIFDERIEADAIGQPYAEARALLMGVAFELVHVYDDLAADGRKDLDIFNAIRRVRKDIEETFRAMFSYGRTVCSKRSGYYQKDRDDILQKIPAGMHTKRFMLLLETLTAAKSHLKKAW